MCRFGLSRKEPPPFIKVHKQTIELEQDGVPVRLTICDTPGFAENIDNELAFCTISDYLEKQCHDILGEESRIKRNARLEDNRVHALLYFIAPTGHRWEREDFLPSHHEQQLDIDHLRWQLERNRYRVDEAFIPPG